MPPGRPAEPLRRRGADTLIREHKTFTEGRILVQGRNTKRGRQQRVDDLLYSRRDFPIAVVEAKSAYLSPGRGLQQASDSAVVRDSPFASTLPSPQARLPSGSAR
ncbi:hypothetical protein ABOD76_03290 (plasmid) [Deinococcus sonorensis KR-87]|uniref:Uncharacterized protein n=1 Tax=Deinococcus sonorensis KR-87 TaxID=694439 RepID=A0AAU7U635_9DEIO